MNVPISSTEAVRNFSELLNNIKYRGDRYTVIRGGKPGDGRKSGGRTRR